MKSIKLRIFVGFVVNFSGYFQCKIDYCILEWVAMWHVDDCSSIVRTADIPWSVLWNGHKVISLLVGAGCLCCCCSDVVSPALWPSSPSQRGVHRPALRICRPVRRASRPVGRRGGDYTSAVDNWSTPPTALLIHARRLRRRNKYENVNRTASHPMINCCIGDRCSCATAVLREHRDMASTLESG